MEEKLFERLAAEELDHLERVLGALDPDEVEVEQSHDVLTLTLAGGDAIVINSHRAARQIWMAAMRRAWHFSPHEEEGRWRWRADDEELRQVLAGLISSRLGRPLDI